MCKRMVITEIATLVGARMNCLNSGNDEYFDKHTEKLEELADNCLPTGSGFDRGTKINLGRSKEDRIYLTTEYHFIKDGTYVGWEKYSIVVTPSLMNGFDLRIVGESVDDIKEYITDIFYDALGQS